MSAIVPFETAGLPAHLAGFGTAEADDLIAGATGGFTSISIKGKVFHMVRGDERTLVTKPGEGEDEPAAAIEVVILKANPSLSKVFYAKGYEEGSADKPDCYSNDGVAPAVNAQTPQAKQCATCPHNQWGSRVSESGTKGKSCSDSRRIAVAPVGQLNDPMLLRVPAASLKTLAQYGDLLKKRGVPYRAVSTRVGFDYTVAHPALTFKPVGFISAEMAAQVSETLVSPVIGQILGGAPVAAPAPAAALPKPAAPQAAPAPAAEPPKPAKPAKEVKAAKAPAVDLGSLEDDIDKVLSGDLDD